MTKTDALGGRPTLPPTPSLPEGPIPVQNKPQSVAVEGVPPPRHVSGAPLAEAAAKSRAEAIAKMLGPNAITIATDAVAQLAGLATAVRRTIEPPVLVWDAGMFQGKAPLSVVQGLPGSPFETRKAALDAIAVRRDRARDHVFLVTRTAGGFVAFEYAEKKLGRVALAELSTLGLPLGGDPYQPQTWVVDGKGKLGQLTPDTSGYELWDTGFTVKRGLDLGEPPPIQGDPLPFVAAARQTNHGKNVSWTPSLAFKPSADIDELSRILRHVDQSLPPSTKIKAGGSRHSWSSVAATDGVYVHPEGIKFVEGLAADAALRVAPETKENLVRIGSGTKVREINRALWDMGKSLPVLGGYDGQTIGGVLPTGTHGSVLDRGPLMSMVRSMDMVRADGTQLRIEPKNGITDPVAFAKQHPNMALIQDDQTFQASLIHLGALGIVHSYTLEAVDRFHMKEVRTESTTAEVKQKLAGGNLYNMMQVTAVPPGVAPDKGLRFAKHPDEAYHLELLFNPHSDKISVTSRQPVELGHDEPKNFGDRPDRDLFRALKLGDRLTRPAFPNWLSANFAQAIGWTVEKATRLFPKITPGLVDAAMGALKDEQYTQRSYNVFNVGDGANAIPALSGTLYVPLRGDMYLKALDVLKETARKYAEKNDAYQTGPTSMRFIKGSDALLGCPEDVCSFEIIFAGGTAHAEDMMREYAAAMKKAFGRDARMHWGQLSPGLDAAQVKDCYKGSGAWREVRDRLDPHRRFSNAGQEAILPPA